jgi:hypothetical protein
VTSYATVLPATVQGTRRYLGLGLIKGIGPVMAARMVAHFGAGILAIIETEPGRLIEVHGLGPKRTKKIAGVWAEQKAMSQAADNGHCYLSQPNLITDASKILEVDRGLIGPCLDELVATGGVVRELVPGEGGDLLPAVYLVAFHRAEQSLVTGLLALAELPAGAAAGIRSRGLGQGAVMAARPDRAAPGPRAAGGGPAHPDAEGGRANRRPRLREELHRPFHRRARHGQERHRDAGRPTGRAAWLWAGIQPARGDG